MLRNAVLIVASLLIYSLPAWAASSEETGSVMIIVSRARCVESAGIPIHEVDDNQVKLACLRDRTVQARCNPDGQHARMQAFRRWQTQLMDFKDRCTLVGGTFAYAAPGFKEPIDESFCSQAQPEVQYNRFETPMCNFVSDCPAVAVTCQLFEESVAARRVVALPGIPLPIELQR